MEKSKRSNHGLSRPSMAFEALGLLPVEEHTKNTKKSSAMRGKRLNYEKHGRCSTPPDRLRQESALLRVLRVLRGSVS
jgi:hypothetical protein